MKIKYSEIFYSFQGEAELAGKPAVWLRFFGCNLECNGFGQTNPANESTWKLPYQDINIDDITSVEQLPVFDKGCDSSYSWSFKYKHLCPSEDVSIVCDKIEEALPNGRFALLEKCPGRTDNMLCFTGGEPMLRQKHMMAIIKEFIHRDNVPRTITVETNGTKPITPEFKEFIKMLTYEYDIRWHWAISPKLLHTAGEKDAFIADVILGYLNVCSRVTGILKFVCNGTFESWNEISNNLKQMEKEIEYYDLSFPDVWIMPVGATKEQQETIADIAVEAMQRGYFVATRNHAYVFGNQIGT